MKYSDIYTHSTAVRLSDVQIEWIRSKGKLNDIIRRLIDKEIEGEKNERITGNTK